MTPAEISAACEGTIDAIGYTCDGGRNFSVRYEPDTYCAIVFAGEHTLVMPEVSTRRGPANSNGVAVLRRASRGATATLTGTPDGDYLNCRLIEN